MAPSPRSGRELRAALDTWNSDARISWHDIAHQFDFPSEPAAQVAVHRFAKKTGLVLRRGCPRPNDEQVRAAYESRLAGLAWADIAAVHGYRDVRQAMKAVQAWACGRMGLPFPRPGEP